MAGSETADIAPAEVPSDDSQAEPGSYCHSEMMGEEGRDLVLCVDGTENQFGTKARGFMDHQPCSIC